MATEQDIFKLLAQQQQDFEKQVNNRIENAISTMMQTQEHETLRDSQIGNPHYGGTEGQTRREIDLLSRRVENLESRPIGFQLPISFRFRNDIEDGTGSIQRLEYIIRPTPYSDTTETNEGTTFWPDDEWIAIPGADAETYTP